MADQNSAGVNPPVTAQVETPTPAPAAEVRSLNSQQDFASRVQSAKSPEAVRQLLAEAKKAKPLDTSVTPPDGKAGLKPASDIPPDLVNAESNTAPVEAAPTETAEPTAETDETSTQEAAPVPEAQTDDEDEGGEGDGPVTPLTSRKAHLRLPENDQLGRLAASYMKRNKDMPMEEALNRARTQLGIAPKDAPAAEAKPKSDLPETVEAVDATLDQLDIEREKALTEVRFEDVAKIDRQMRKLDRHRTALERDGERRLVEAKTTYERSFATSESKAVELYEFAANPESPGGKRMAEIDRMLEQNADPLFHSADKPLRIAQMVAAEMNIAPRRKGAPPAPAKPAVPPPQLQQKKQVLPSGSARTTVPLNNQQPAVNAEIQGMKSVRDLRQFAKKLGIPAH